MKANRPMRTAWDFFIHKNSKALGVYVKIKIENHTTKGFSGNTRLKSLNSYSRCTTFYRKSVIRRTCLVSPVTSSYK